MALGVDEMAEGGRRDTTALCVVGAEWNGRKMLWHAAAAAQSAAAVGETSVKG